MGNSQAKSRSKDNENSGSSVDGLRVDPSESNGNVLNPPEITKCGTQCNNTNCDPSVKLAPANKSDSESQMSEKGKKEMESDIPNSSGVALDPSSLKGDSTDGTGKIVSHLPETKNSLQRSDNIDSDDSTDEFVMARTSPVENIREHYENESLRSLSTKDTSNVDEMKSDRGDLSASITAKDLDLTLLSQESAEVNNSVFVSSCNSKQDRKLEVMEIPTNEDHILKQDVDSNERTVLYFPSDFNQKQDQERNKVTDSVMQNNPDIKQKQEEDEDTSPVSSNASNLEHNLERDGTTVTITKSVSNQIQTSESANLRESQETADGAYDMNKINRNQNADEDTEADTCIRMDPNLTQELEPAEVTMVVSMNDSKHCLQESYAAYDVTENLLKTGNVSKSLSSPGQNRDTIFQTPYLESYDKNYESNEIMISRNEPTSYTKHGQCKSYYSSSVETTESPDLNETEDKHNQSQSRESSFSPMNIATHSKFDVTRNEETFSSSQTDDIAFKNNDSEKESVINTNRSETNNLISSSAGTENESLTPSLKRGLKCMETQTSCEYDIIQLQVQNCFDSVSEIENSHEKIREQLATGIDCKTRDYEEGDKCLREIEQILKYKTEKREQKDSMIKQLQVLLLELNKKVDVIEQEVHMLSKRDSQHLESTTLHTYESEPECEDDSLEEMCTDGKECVKENISRIDNVHSQNGRRKNRSGSSTESFGNAENFVQQSSQILEDDTFSGRKIIKAKRAFSVKTQVLSHEPNTIKKGQSHGNCGTGQLSDKDNASIHKTESQSSPLNVDKQMQMSLPNAAVSKPLLIRTTQDKHKIDPSNSSDVMVSPESFDNIGQMLASSEQNPPPRSPHFNAPGQLKNVNIKQISLPYSPNIKVEQCESKDMKPKTMVEEHEIQNKTQSSLPDFQNKKERKSEKLSLPSPNTQITQIETNNVQQPRSEGITVEQKKGQSTNKSNLPDSSNVKFDPRDRKSKVDNSTNISVDEFTNSADIKPVVHCADPCHWVNEANTELMRARNQPKSNVGGGPDTVLCFDTSDSMKGESYRMMITLGLRLVAAVEKCKLETSLAENIGVVAFGNETKVFTHVSGDYKQIRKEIKCMRPGGPSPLTAGLMLAVAVGFAGKTPCINGRIFCPRVIVFTDGEATPDSIGGGQEFIPSQGQMMEIQSRLSMAVSHFRRKGIRVFCVPIGQMPSETILFTLAAETGGKVIQPGNFDKLIRQYRNEVLAAGVKQNIPGNLSSKDDKMLRSTIEAAVADSSTNMDEYDIEDIMEYAKHPPPQIMEDDEDDDDDNSCRYRECDPAMPPIGTRVRRGPDWIDRYSGQDGDLPGTVVSHTTNGQIWICWDNGHRNVYPYGAGGRFAVVIVDEPRILQQDQLIEVGCLVKRGCNWRDKDEDGGKGNIGVVFRVHRDATVGVRWPTRNLRRYKYGKQGFFEVEICDPFDADVRVKVSGQTTLQGSKKNLKPKNEDTAPRSEDIINSAEREKPKGKLTVDEMNKRNASRTKSQKIVTDIEVDNPSEGNDVKAEISEKSTEDIGSRDIASSMTERTLQSNDGENNEEPYTPEPTEDHVISGEQASYQRDTSGNTSQQTEHLHIDVKTTDPKQSRKSIRENFEVITKNTDRVSQVSNEDQADSNEQADYHQKLDNLVLDESKQLQEVNTKPLLTEEHTDMVMSGAMRTVADDTQSEATSSTFSSRTSSLCESDDQKKDLHMHCKDDKKADDKVIWQIADGYGGWKDFSVDLNQKLESSYQRNPKATFSYHEGKKRYQVIFSSMKHVHPITKQLSSVRRKVCTV